MDEENAFSQAEWEALRPPGETADWLYYSGSEITVKNPSKRQIVAFVKLARDHGWKVLGDEDEEYDVDGNGIPEEPSPPVGKPWNPLKNWLARREAQKSVGPCGVKVGATG